jgi:hypothetical protein
MRPARIRNFLLAFEDDASSLINEMARTRVEDSLMVSYLSFQETN